MRQRQLLDRYQFAEGITQTYQLWSVSHGTLLDEQITELVPAASYPTRYVWMEDGLGYSKTGVVYHYSRKLKAEGTISLHQSYLTGSDWRIEHHTSGSALAFFYFFGGSLTSGFSSEMWDTVDLSRLDILDDSSSESFYGLETGKDVLKLILSARKLDVRKVALNFRKVMKRFRVNPKSTASGIKRALSATSNGFLAYNFGVKPLVSDIASIGASYDLYHASLQKGAGTTQESFKKSSRAYSTEYAVPEALWPAAGEANGVIGKLTSREAISRLTAEVKVKQSDVSSTYLSYLKGHLKLTDLVGLGWELIPFSFVADWFLHIDKRIATSQSYLSKQYANPALVRNRNISQKRHSMYDVKLYTEFSFTGGFGDNVQKLGVVEETTYLRNTPLVNGLDLFSLSGFKSFQRQLSAALVWQMLSGMLGKKRG